MYQSFDEVELFMGEKMDIPYQLMLKGRYIYTLYITSTVESELCNLLQVKNPSSLSLTIVNLIKAGNIHIRVNEDEEYLILMYNEYSLGGKIKQSNNYGHLFCSLSKVSF